MSNENITSTDFWDPTSTCDSCLSCRLEISVERSYEARLASWSHITYCVHAIGQGDVGKGGLLTGFIGSLSTCTSPWNIYPHISRRFFPHTFALLCKHGAQALRLPFFSFSLTLLCFFLILLLFFWPLRWRWYCYTNQADYRFPFPRSVRGICLLLELICFFIFGPYYL
ncbi:hypothetical protein ASPZODRAFT_1327197 [Penicilliopsis zonata CBS 506.65]|uniref:Uncharacterized protein n=1 Tax=Penicilliopsis zonata CBS 506.65 TaxID=1073090 RepID=A0A1L9SNQ9_9EURO|nr:hypothetical protein ASPZODRAFT_1327197 [Penicilliopsis zonata CBS 506.65]OJJ48828.1 hypothetical protein ASPZODRAFT_1327197 [Penicilliopsis zonata CBS 506.65]